MVDHDKREKFITDTLFSFISLIFQYLSVFIIMIFIVRNLKAFGYGIYSQFSTTLSLVSILVCLNLGHSMSRFFAGEKKIDYISNVFSSIYLVVSLSSFLIGLGMVIFRFPLSNFLFGSYDYAPIIIFLAIILIIKSLRSENQAFLKARRKIKALSLIDSIYFVLMATTIVVLSILTKNIFLIIKSIVFIETIVLLVTIFFILKQGVRPTKPSFKLLFPLLKFGPPLLIASLGYWFTQLSDRYLINYFKGISEVGIYSLSYGIASILAIFWLLLDNIIFPDLSALYDSNRKKELEKRFTRILKYGVAITLPSVLGILILAKPIVKIFSSGEFIDSYKVLIIISIAMFFYGIFAHFSVLLNVLKKVKVLNSLWIFMATINIFLNILFIPKFGMMGAAYSTLVSFLFGVIAIVFYSNFYFDIIFPKSWIAKILISSIIMGFIINLIFIPSFLVLILTIFMGAFVYGIILFSLKFYDISELSLLKDTLKNKYKSY
jgi:O-antigen/teichoic acid export membrane protein